MGTHMGRIPWPRFSADDLAALIHFLSDNWAPKAAVLASNEKP
jgi:hypothetical protein